jgi:hypothetical protein
MSNFETTKKFGKISNLNQNTKFWSKKGNLNQTLNFELKTKA